MIIIKQPAVHPQRAPENDDTFNHAGGQRALHEYLRGHRQMQREMYANHPTARPWIDETPR